jgi:PTS system mannitol-specific IIC component
MESTTYTPPVTGTGWQATAQRVGGWLAGMIMPNIGAFVAWGLITTLFIPDGWTPNERFAVLVGPMIFYMLPLLIGYTGGRMVHGQRGAVIGAIATMGVIEGGTIITDGEPSKIPMFLGAMIISPFAAWVLKLWDDRVQDRVAAGFEMLVDNFSLGIIGVGMAMLGVWGVGPIVRNLADWLGDGVDALVDENLLPLASILIEPAKVLFLNNAINHGVLGPIGVADAAESGKSIMFMLETNPGPGLGILIAYWLCGPKMLKPSVPAAAIIHFLGGIHEIYFPYILMKPRLILAVIAGGASGVAVFQATDAGLRATPSPGSIFAYITQTPGGDMVWVLLGIAVSTAVSAGVASALLGFGRKDDVADELEGADELEEAKEEARRRKAESKLAPAEGT